MHDRAATITVALDAIEFDGLEDALAEDVGIAAQERLRLVPDHRVARKPPLDGYTRSTVARGRRRRLALAAVPEAGARIEDVVVQAIDDGSNLRVLADDQALFPDGREDIERVEVDREGDCVLQLRCGFSVVTAPAPRLGDAAAPLANSVPVAVRCNDGDGTARAPGLGTGEGPDPALWLARPREGPFVDVECSDIGRFLL